jgi:hypothetical protein
MRLSVNIPGAPLSADVINGGGPSARAVVSSVGVRRGFAALPDPGDGAMAGPGTAAGALGTYGAVLPAAVPPYPFAAVADYPGTPEQTVGGGPVFAKATSGERSATGEAQGGFLQDGTGVLAARSEAAAEESDTGVVSRAAAVFKGLVVGPLALGNVTSTAKVTLGVDGALQRTASLDVVGGRAGDQTFTITGKGILFGGQTVPVPFSDGVASLNQQLAASKVRIGFSSQRETGSGVVAPVLEITSPVRSLSPGLPEGTMALRIGGSAASIDTEASQVAAAPSATDVAPAPESPPSSEPASASAGSETTSGVGSFTGSQDSTLFSANPGPVVGATGFQLTTPAPGLETASAPPSLPTAEPAPEEVALAAAPGATGLTSPAVRSIEESFGSNTVYVVIAVAALVGMACGRLFRVGGRWNS